MTKHTQFKSKLLKILILTQSSPNSSFLTLKNSTKNPYPSATCLSFLKLHFYTKNNHMLFFVLSFSPFFSRSIWPKIVEFGDLLTWLLVWACDWGRNVVALLKFLLLHFSMSWFLVLAWRRWVFWEKFSNTEILFGRTLKRINCAFLLEKVTLFNVRSLICF